MSSSTILSDARAAASIVVPLPQTFTRLLLLVTALLGWQTPLSAAVAPPDCTSPSVTPRGCLVTQHRSVFYLNPLTTVSGPASLSLAQAGDPITLSFSGNQFPGGVEQFIRWQTMTGYSGECAQGVQTDGCATVTLVPTETCIESKPSCIYTLESGTPNRIYSVVYIVQYGILCTTCGDGSITVFSGDDWAWDTFVLTVQSNDPTADFTFTQSSPAQSPGSYQFVDASTDPDGDIATYEWTFGDGGTATGTTAVHTYTRPGDYSVALKVTDSEGRTSTKTRQVSVAAPTLGVAISFPGNANALFDPESRFPVDVVLSASNGVGDLSGVQFNGAPLGWAPTASLGLVSGPVPPLSAPLTLAPGSAASFRFEFDALTSGNVTLTSQARASDAAGRLVSGNGQRNLRVAAGDVLGVVVTATPATLNLEDNDDGPIPQPVEVKVTVTNIATTPVHNIVITDLNLASKLLPAPVPATLVDLTDTSDGRNVIGTLGAGLSRTVTYNLEARDEGRYDVVALVQATHPETQGTAIASGAVEVLINQKVLFYFESTAVAPEVGGVALVRGGDKWSIEGNMENRSFDKTLLVRLIPQRIGNAGFAVPIPDGELPPDDLSCGVGLVKRLIPDSPDSKITFKAPVTSLLDGGTRATVVYKPQAFIVEDDDSLTPLTDEQIRIKAGSAEHIVRIDTGERAPDASVGEVLYVFGTSAVAGFGSFVEGIASMGFLAIQATAIGLQPWLWDESFQRMNDALSAYLVEVYNNLPPEDKAAWMESEVFAAGTLLGLTGAELASAVNRSVEESLTELTTAWETGDAMATARWWGRFLGENPDTLVDVALGAYAVCKLVGRGTQWARKALTAKAASRAASLPADAAQGARGLKNGHALDYLNHRRVIFGIDRALDVNLRKLAAEFDVILVGKRRGLRSAAKIESGNYLGKMDSLQAKNATARIDRDVLGIPDEFVDEVVIFEPPPWAQVENALAGRDADFVAEARQRWLTRWEEWNGKGASEVGGLGGDAAKNHRLIWDGYEADGVPYNRKNLGTTMKKNFAEGFALPADATNWDKLPFEPIKRHYTDAFGNVRELRVAKIVDNGVTKGLTGDFDLLAVIHPNGKVPPDGLRLKIYRALREAGIEHPESLTFNDLDARRAILSQHDVKHPGSEALLGYHPDGTTNAMRFDLDRSWTPPPGATGTAYLLFKGAQMAIQSRESAPPAVNGLLEDPGAQPVFIGPDTWALQDEACPGSEPGSPATCAAKVSLRASGEAPILQPLVDARYQSWTPADQWQPYTPGGQQIVTQPMTAVSDLVAPGSTRLPIAAPEEIGLDPAANDWFRPGHTIVINPGGPTQEYARVAALGSLLLEAPLLHHHRVGEIVAVVPPRLLARDSDGDGVADVEDPFPFDANLSDRDSDGDGIGDRDDPDDDGDGFDDLVEQQAGSNWLDANDTPDAHRPARPSLFNVTADSAAPLTQLRLDRSLFVDPDPLSSASALELEISDPQRSGAEAVRFRRRLEAPLVDAVTLPHGTLDGDYTYQVTLRYVDNRGLASDASDPVALLTGADVDDLDGNGIQDTAEVGAATDLDGNGMDDAGQGLVVIANAENGGPAALGTDRGRIVRVFARPQEELPLPYSLAGDFPIGLLGFRIDGLEPGAQVVLSLWSHGAGGADSWYQWDPTGWDLRDHSAATAWSGMRIDVTYTDGGEGDLDGVANGTLLDPGGPVIASSDPLVASMRDSGACFIATAVYGGYDTPEVRTLRRFRDRFLAPSAAGRQFIDWYYARSPAWAEWVETRPGLRPLLQVAMQPLVWLAVWVLDAAWTIVVLVTIIVALVCSRCTRRPLPVRQG